MSFLSSLLGQDAQHNADQAMQQSKQYGQQAASGYGNLGTQGQQQYNFWDSALPGLAGQFAGASGFGMPGSSGPQGASAYQLNPYQRQQLNSGLDAISQMRQQALQSYTAELGNHGIYDPAAAAAGHEAINLHFGGLADSHTANFMEQQRQAAQQSILQMMGFGANEAQAGAQMQGQGAGGMAGLSGAQAQLAAQEQQSANAAMGNIMQLAAFGASGGFSGLGGLFGGGGGGGDAFANSPGMAVAGSTETVNDLPNSELFGGG